MTFADLARRGAKLAIDHSPSILTSVGVMGAITTAYLAGKASWQASDMIRLKEGLDYRSEEDRRDAKELVKDRFELVWRLYIPAATTLVATTACIIGANKVGARRAAGLAAAYTITEKTLDEYKDKVREKLGERKEAALQDEIIQDRVNTSYTPGVEIYGATTGELCYDAYSDRYFMNTIEGMRSAENDLNFALLSDGYASLAEFYQYLGLPSTAYAEQVGWNSDRKLEIRISSQIAHGEKPCISMDFKTQPIPDYGRFRG